MLVQFKKTTMATLKQFTKLLAFLYTLILVNSTLHAQIEAFDVVVNVAGDGTDGVVIDDANALETAIPAPPVSLASDSFGNVYFTFAGTYEAPKSGVYKIKASDGTIVHLLDYLPSTSGIAINKETNTLYLSRGYVPPSDFTTMEYIFSYDLSDPDAEIDTIAGNGFNGDPEDVVHARETHIGAASGLKVDPTGEYLYYAAPGLGGDGEGINFIQRINLSTSITERVVGDGIEGYLTFASNGDEAVSAEVACAPSAFDWDSNGNLYFFTTDHYLMKVVDGKVYYVAGSGESDYSGDGGLAADASISISTSGIRIDRTTDELYFCDTGNNRIRKIQLSGTDAPDGLITTYCGTGEAEGDNPDSDLLNGQFRLPLNTNIRPYDLIEAEGDIYFSDDVGRIRKITTCKSPEIAGTNLSTTTICNGDEVTMIIDGVLNDANQWTWYEDELLPINVIEGANETSLTVTVDQNKTYYVKGTGGCANLSLDYHQFDLEITCKDYFNTFTPNGDGINDFLEIPSLENYPENSVRIYNRWGDQLEVIQNYDNVTTVWAGTNGAVDLDAGTYYFTAEASGVLIASGWVQLIK